MHSVAQTEPVAIRPITALVPSALKSLNVMKSSQTLVARTTHTESLTQPSACSPNDSL